MCQLEGGCESKASESKKDLQAFFKRIYFSVRTRMYTVAIDLSTISSLPIKLDSRSPKLWFSKGLVSKESVSRRIGDMREVMIDPEAKGPEKLYTMYTNVRFPKDENTLRSNNLRYDLTVIRSGFIGNEFIKTLGHYHPVLPGQGISYPEVYE
ncbi:MAG: glucose-6-phosphate isomerase family protein, partial [Thermodesulfobacteriota bacterium]